MSVAAESQSAFRMHVGRAWAGHEIEDACPCPKAPCGLVVELDAVSGCGQHGFTAARTMRQLHLERDCPTSRDRRASA